MAKLSCVGLLSSVITVSLAGNFVLFTLFMQTREKAQTAQAFKKPQPIFENVSDRSALKTDSVRDITVTRNPCTQRKNTGRSPDSDDIETNDITTPRRVAWIGKRAVEAVGHVPEHIGDRTGTPAEADGPAATKRSETLKARHRAGVGGAGGDRAGKVHILFTTECIRYFDWQSIALYESWKALKHPGRITRLSACNKKQLKAAGKERLNAVPTFVHPNYRVPEDLPASWLASHNVSASYNKPGGLMHFLQETSAEELGDEEFIVHMDGDMLLTQVIDPVKLGVREGHVVSQVDDALQEGLDLGIARQFMTDAERKAPLAAVGYVHVFHVADARRVAPLWFNYTGEIRMHPERYWASLGRVRRDFLPASQADRGEGAPWMSEMYGYVLAASKAGLGHSALRGLVQQYRFSWRPRFAPSVLHYTWPCEVNSTKTAGRAYKLDKHARYDQQGDIFDCAGYQKAVRLNGGIPYLLQEPEWAEVDDSAWWCAWGIKTINHGLREWFERTVCPAAGWDVLAASVW